MEILSSLALFALSVAIVVHAVLGFFRDLKKETDKHNKK